MTTLATRTRTRVQCASYGAHLALVLAVAFVLSAAHTVYSYVVGIQDPGFTVTTPAAYAFYAVGFASAALAHKEARWAQAILLLYVGVLIVVAVFWYPTTFVARQQTVFGWFENDVYTGLLMIAGYLGVQRFRAVTLTPAGSR